MLDLEFLKTLEQITLLCRDNVEGGVGAGRQSSRRGPGLEFADYRGYRSGEDTRLLDWNAYLRLGKLFLKVYTLEQNINVRILLDRSASMDCHDSDVTKFEYGQRLAATFAYLALLRLDRAVVVPFADRISEPLAVSGGRERFWPVVQYLNTLSCAGTTALAHSVTQFLERMPASGLVVIISDFFDEADCARAVDMLHAAGHDIVLLHVHSAEEQQPSVRGEVTLEDVETGETRIVECSAESAAEYERAFLESCERIERVATRRGGRYARAATGVPFQEFVLTALRTHGLAS